jgi:hypothetical protein
MIVPLQVLIELDPETLRRLEQVAPGRSRKRSAFIRAAILQSLWALEEDKTRQAYLSDPDLEPAPFRTRCAGLGCLSPLAFAPSSC